MSIMALLGVDLGTSSVKALVVRPDGQILSRGVSEYAIDRPKPDWAEQSPETWWAATVEAVRQATTGLDGRSGDIDAIGLSGQMHGTVLLDEAGKLLNNAVIWPDRRSQRQVTEISTAIGTQRLMHITGSPLATGFQAATIRWFQQERPALWRQVATVLTPKDYLQWRLTGQLGSEPSDGSGTLLLDVHQRDWSADVLSTLGIDPGQLPEIQRSSAVAGHLAREPAAELALLPGTPVINGAADTACGLLGAGVVDDRSLLLTIGSGGQLVVPAFKAVIDPEGRLHTFCGGLEPAEGRPGWYQMAAILSAGLALRWLRYEILGLTGADGYDVMTTLAKQAPPGANGLLFLPYLQGERTPHLDSQARGLFLGLTAAHGQAEMIRAVMEGVVLACYDAFGVLEQVGARPDHIIMAGGGARSDLWRQIVADVFNRPVRRLATGEQAAVGAALLAGDGLGSLDIAKRAREWSRYEGPVQPSTKANQVYGRLLGIFRDAYRKHKDDFAELGRL